jgi:hypothetical protein
MPSSAAQDEFNALIHGIGLHSSSRPHPEDLLDDEESNSNSASHQSSTDSTTRPLRSRAGAPDQGSDFEDDDDDELFADTNMLSVAQHGNAMKSRYFIPSQRSNANTGPKGVIADAQAFEQARRAHRDRSPQNNKTAMTEIKQPSANHWTELDKSDKDEGHFSDDEFMASWRQKRLKELSSGQRVWESPSGRTYGSLSRVNSEGFLDAIENAPRDTVVVVFIYDDTVSWLVTARERRIPLTRPSSPTSRCLSSSASDLWPKRMSQLASSSSISLRLRSRLREYQLSSHTAAETNSLDWCQL